MMNIKAAIRLLCTFGVIIAGLGVSGMAKPPSQLVAELDCEAGYTSCFDGTSLPGAGGSPADLWDNPIDDDWKEAAFRKHVWLINQRSADGETYMRIDRTKIDGPGWIMRRDPHLTPDSGVEIVLRVRVPKASTSDGLALIYIDRSAHFALGLEPDKVLLNPVGNQRASERATTAHIAKLDLASGFQTLIIRKQPGSEAVAVSVVEEGDERLLLEGKASKTPRGPGQPGHLTRISFGDNQDDYHSKLLPVRGMQPARGIVDLAFLGWRPLLLSEPKEFAMAEMGDRNWTYKPKLNPRRPGSGRAYVPWGLIDSRKDLLLEWRFRFGANVPDGFHMSWLDGEYSYSIVAYDDRVQAKLYGKPVGAAPIKPEAWNPSKETCLRLHRPAGQPYAWLYLNDDPKPIMGPIVGGSSGAKKALVIFGGNTVPATPEKAWEAANHGQELPALGQYGVPVDVSLIKVHVGRVGLSDIAPCATGK